MNNLASGNVKSIEVLATVIRKDGTREDLGCIARYERSSLLQRFLRALKFWR